MNLEQHNFDYTSLVPAKYWELNFMDTFSHQENW